MRKLFALYTNEMIKTSKKVSVIIILAIMVAIIFGFGGLMKYQDHVNNSENNRYNYGLEQRKNDMNRQLENAKTRLEEVKKKKTSASEQELVQLTTEEYLTQNEIDMLNFAIDKDILLYTSSYRALATQKLFTNKQIVNQLNALPDNMKSDDSQKQLTKVLQEISTLEKIINEKDFKGYISYQNDMINNSPERSDEEKKLKIETNDLILKYNLTGEPEGNMYSEGNALRYISQIETGKLSLLHNLEYTSTGSLSAKPLTEEQRDNIENNIAVIEYKFEKGILSNTSTDNFEMAVKGIVMPGMLGISIFMVAVLGMILAGGSISSEMSTGSIKSLIISPTKRWKIFTAKALSLISVAVIATIIGYIFSVIANGIFFGFSTGDPYIFAKDGVAHEMNFYVYQFARIFTDFISVIVFMTFAFMLSIITRNTAASVAISIAVYFVGSSANQILMRFLKGDWRKFIPFNNLDFTSKIFPNDSLTQVANSMPGTINNSLMFSLIYVVILLVCMGYVGLDSFNRRDIK